MQKRSAALSDTERDGTKKWELAMMGCEQVNVVIYEYLTDFLHC
jgi:hypothetical protein